MKDQGVRGLREKGTSEYYYHRCKKDVGNKNSNFHTNGSPLLANFCPKRLSNRLFRSEVEMFLFSS